MHEQVGMQTIEIAVKDLKSRGNIREPTLDDDIEALGQSLLVRQEQPIILDPEGFLIDGWRRWMAAQHAKIEFLWAVVTNRKLSDSELKLAQLRMAVHRRDISEYERFATCQALSEMNKGWSQKDLAAHIGVDAPTITRWTSPSRCIPEVREALKEGKIGLTSCYEISKATVENQPELLRAKLAGESRDSIAERVRRQKRADKPEEKITRIRCILPNDITILVTGKKMGLQDFVDALIDATKQAKAAIADHQTAQTFTQMSRNRCRGGR